MNKKEQDNLANSIAFKMLMAIALVGCVAMYVYKFITDKILISPYIFSIMFFGGMAVDFIVKLVITKNNKIRLYAIIAIVLFVIDIILLKFGYGN